MQDMARTKRASWQMFNRIAGRYDLLNRLLSLRQDVRWRRRLTDKLPQRDHLNVVDLATGTADLMLTLHQRCPQIRSMIGIDPARNMLTLGRKKLERIMFRSQPFLIQGDAHHLSLHSKSADVVTMAFGIRNISNLQPVLAEIKRVLRESGKLFILEFSLPTHRFIRAIYLFYFRHILPRIGRWISGDSTAYTYLNHTVEDFPYGEAFCAILEKAGFTHVHAEPLTFGVVTIYSAVHP
ncbi:MAG: bifunctional demethylmenaquinone methyltransferase/2-methoxy-6-polyprenyl-1,4-benzoquinol methylase UbiE [Calditrichaeota bacterium]|nr:MAG: bifunctional demethylmenaquinone methyltransferase/2-methoxy-6-polyprenyl-1,4-benzoquinol methylase UbiE [Calditrichota bacterium]